MSLLTCSRCKAKKPTTEFNKCSRLRTGFQSICRECQKSYYDPEQNKARCRAWYAAHREEAAASGREWAQKNPERSRAIKQRWIESNYEKRLEVGRASYYRHKEEHKAYTLENNKRRRARKKQAPINDLTTAQWLVILEQHEHRCYYCNRPLNDKRLPTQDHKIPLVRGGGHTASNIVPACRSCNSRKRTRTDSEFKVVLRQQQDRLAA